MRNETTYGNGFIGVFKGTLAALAASFLCLMVFAAVLESGRIPDKAVYPVTQTLKAMAIAFGALVFTRGEKGWLKGGAIGLLYTALSYLAFSFLGGDFSLSWLIFLELFIALAIGMLGGIVAVNMRR